MLVLVCRDGTCKPPAVDFPSKIEDGDHLYLYVGVTGKRAEPQALNPDKSLMFAFYTRLWTGPGCGRCTDLVPPILASDQEHKQGLWGYVKSLS